MPSGFEGWISVFEDDNVDGSTFSNPQVWHVDKETLTFGKSIERNARLLSQSRSPRVEELLYKEAKPEGEVVYQFRASDILKPLYCHFQLATLISTTLPYRYGFYTRTNPLDWENRGTYPTGTYGAAYGRPYTISVLKKTFDTSDYGGTNSYFFQHGIVNKLTFDCQSGDDAKLAVSFKFRDLDKGTPVSANPNSSSTGSYSTDSCFYSHSATVTLDGFAFDISGFQVESNQGVQEYSRVGRQAPENYQFSNYSARGAFTLDLPSTAQDHVEGMFNGNTFSFVATLFNGTSERVILDMPYCRRLPFDFQNPGNTSWKGRIPFEAFESTGIHPLKVTVDTSYQLSPILEVWGDASLGARGVGYGTYDAGTASRTLLDYIIYSHS